ncbi:hypothetical protein ACFMBG_15845 [Leisingera sp. D0M16]|uniref:hypothetical protein n=1 Tax=Leisingera coralii TaxID=3351347 RepID=UPI003B7BB439
MFIKIITRFLLVTPLRVIYGALETFRGTVFLAAVSLGTVPLQELQLFDFSAASRPWAAAA